MHMSKKGVSTGSTLLNLAITGDPFYGFIPGKYFFLVGDSSSGKTFLSMSVFGEATINEHLKDYRLIYDNGEDGMLIDIDNLFSEAVADRIEPPAKTKDNEPIYSDTVESFYYHLDDAVKAGKPFIYVLDSMDNLTSEASDKKFDLHKKAYRKKLNKGDGEEGGKEDKVAGSYGDGKAKKNSESLRKAMAGLRKNGSILIILAQTRDDIGALYAGAKTRAGGRALRFYATTEIWSSVREQLKKNVNGKDRKNGVRVRLEGKKNRVNGKLRTVEIDIFPDVGIDDLGSCVDYLVEEKFWETEKQTIKCKGLDNVSGTRDKVIRVIERRGLEDKVRELCGKCWAEIEAALTVRRKNRYAIAEPAEEAPEEA